MNPPGPADSAAAELLLTALRGGELERAESLLAQGLAPRAVARLAETLMRRREWSHATWLFERLPSSERDAAAAMKHRLSSNLAALQRHRPQVYELLLALPAQQQFSVAATPSGQPSIRCRHPDGGVVSLSTSPDPLAAARAGLAALYQRTPGGEAVALCGLGDGYLALLLAQSPPPLFMDKQQAVFVIEPQGHILLQCLMIHDYTGPDGPIEAARFQWFVGAGWQGAFHDALRDDQFLPAPSIWVSQGFDTPRIREGIGATMQSCAARDDDTVRRIETYYATRSTRDFASAFASAGMAGQRPPRVLLLTTRLSTVLQYSTRDTAAAFERLGWETRVIIEPSPHHRVLRSSIAGALADFKPDLVFQIDHLRHEHQDLFPPNLPFACWIQDHLPHLASPDVGRGVGELDFVLTDAIATYSVKFAYPQRQCIPLPKLVAQTEPAERGDRPADDLVFVSNASRPPDQMVAEALRRYARSAHTHELITLCCGEMVRTYESGGSLPTYNDVCGVLRGGLAALGLSLPPDGFDALARWLTHPFNDALYRQQALRWAAAAAREHGLTLALYGKGWESHPEFRPYARGPIAYGEPLRRLTRRSLINLQVVPYLCLHQRLLDGLMAGGFFLVREHPSDIAPAALLRFLHEGGANAARCADEALASLPPARHAALADLIEQCRPCLCTTGTEDVVAMTRAWEEAGQLTAEEGPLPMLSEVGFHDFDSLALRVRKFAGSSGLRESVAARQRRSISGRLSYDAGVRRIVGRVGQLLSETAAREQAVEKTDPALRQPRALAA